MNKVPAPLNWWRLLPLDICVAGTVVATVSALCLARLPVVMDKVRMAEAQVLLSTARTDAAEAYALTGSLERTLPPAASQPGHSTGRFAHAREGDHIVASGVLGQGRPAFQLAFTPSIDPRAPGWSLAMLCGHHPPPPGWVAPAPKVKSRNLSNEQLPLVCRGAPPP